MDLSYKTMETLQVHSSGTWLSVIDDLKMMLIYVQELGIEEGKKNRVDNIV